MGSVCQFSQDANDESLVDGRVKGNLELQGLDDKPTQRKVKNDASMQETNENSGFLVDPEKQFQNKQQELECLLKKRGYVDERIKSIGKQLLILWKEHKCSVVTTSATNGQTKWITDPNSIQHKLCIKTKGKKASLWHQKDKKLWCESQTQIYIQAKPRQFPFGKTCTLHRHIVDIPLQEYV